MIEKTEIINSLLNQAYGYLEATGAPIYKICHLRSGAMFSQKQQTTISLRDSLMFRRNSIQFHLVQLIENNNRLIQFVHEEFKGHRQVPHEQIEEVSTILL